MNLDQINDIPDILMEFLNITRLSGDTQTKPSRDII